MQSFRIPPVIFEAIGKTIIVIEFDAETMTGRIEYKNGKRDGLVEIFIGPDPEEVPF